LKRAALEAHSAEEQGDFSATNEAWRRHRLIADTLRDPEALLAEGIALSETALALAE
jgi:hypothetical protein